MSRQWPSVTVAGCGNMGGGIIRGLVAAGCPADKITAIEKSGELREKLARETGCKTYSQPVAEAMGGDLVVLAVKPQQAATLLPALSNMLAADTILLSIMAGVELADLRSAVPEQQPVVRAMPNLPVIVQGGVTAMVAADTVSQQQRDIVDRIFAATGTVIWLPDEALMDAVTAISGSGPAYFFYFMECLENSAVAMGLDPAMARAMVLQTAVGAAQLATVEGAASPARLRASVTSPGGTTEAALGQFARADVAAIIDAAAIAARDRAAELRELLKDNK